MARKSITETKREIDRLSQQITFLKHKEKEALSQKEYDERNGIVDPRNRVTLKSTQYQLATSLKKIEELNNSIPTIHCNEYLLIIYYIGGGKRYRVTYFGLRNRDEIQAVVERDIQKYKVLLDDFQHVTTGTLEIIE